MDGSDNKEFLPVHVILRASKYANIKTKKDIKVGQNGELVAEYTAFGWVIIAEGKKRTSNCLMSIRRADFDYAELSTLDVLGLKAY